MKTRFRRTRIGRVETSGSSTGRAELLRRIRHPREGERHEAIQGLDDPSRPRAAPDLWLRRLVRLLFVPGIELAEVTP